jgi:hypothetical protein
MTDEIYQGHDNNREKSPPDALASVSAALQRLSFGAIQLTVHNGKVVQLDVTERHRFQD